MKKKMTAFVIFMSSLTTCSQAKDFNYAKLLTKEEKKLKKQILSLSKKEIKKIEKNEIDKFIKEFV